MSWFVPVRPRQRVIVDNDFSGDPDDLFALAHQVLSPSADVRGVIGSHLAPGDWFDPSSQQASNAVAIAQDFLLALGREDIPVVAGSETGIEATGRAASSDAAELIVDEAMRGDAKLPLVVTLGGGLTELARAWLIEPAIEERLTAVWIGGPEYPEHAPQPPGSRGAEYNMNIDIPAAQIVFNESAIPIVQVPRDAYRQCIISLAVLDEHLRACGDIGDRLAKALRGVYSMNERLGHPMGETYVLGDNPLVLMTALQTPWEPAAASTRTVERPTPWITGAGDYSDRAVAVPRPVRVCTDLDVRLMLDDLFAKLRASVVSTHQG